MSQLLLRFLLCVVAACFVFGQVKAQSNASDSQLGPQVDGLLKKIADNVHRREMVAVIDHCRSAREAGVTMPACVVTIFSDPSVNTPLVKIDPRLRIDLPFKVLAYAETEDRGVKVASLKPEFMLRRHGLSEEGQWTDYQKGIVYGAE